MHTHTLLKKWAHSLPAVSPVNPSFRSRRERSTSFFLCSPSYGYPPVELARASWLLIFYRADTTLNGIKTATAITKVICFTLRRSRSDIYGADCPRPELFSQKGRKFGKGNKKMFHYFSIPFNCFSSLHSTSIYCLSNLYINEIKINK